MQFKRSVGLKLYKREFLIYIVAILSVIFYCIPDPLIEIWYNIRVATGGENEIRLILEELNQTDDIYENIENIALWEGRNIEYVYGREPSFRIGNYAFYISGFSIKIRALAGPFHDDPKWIAYYKVGGCGELAVLFSEIANRAGISARVAGDPGLDHAWVEIKINNSWVIADPTLYWWYINDRKNYSDWNKIWFRDYRWYNLMESWGGFSRVIARNLNGGCEDVTGNYTYTSNVTIIILGSKFCKKNLFLKITTWKKSVEKTVYLKEVNISDVINLNLGKRIYKFEVFSLTWYGIEFYGSRVYDVKDIKNPIELKLERTRITENFWVLYGLVLGLLVGFLFGICICKSLKNKKRKKAILIKSLVEFKSCKARV